MAEGIDIGFLSPDYIHLSINALRETSRRKLASYLDLEGTLVVIGEGFDAQDIVNNYNGLAELAGFGYQTIRNLQVRL